jgi:hypothetical protein
VIIGGVMNREITLHFPTKAGKIIDEMPTYQLLKISSTPWSELASWLGN